jgi:hypothetical protein
MPLSTDITKKIRNLNGYVCYGTQSFGGEYAKLKHEITWLGQKQEISD